MTTKSVHQIYTQYKVRDDQNKEFWKLVLEELKEFHDFSLGHGLSIDSESDLGSLKLVGDRLKNGKKTVLEVNFVQNRLSQNKDPIIITDGVYVVKPHGGSIELDREGGDGKLVIGSLLSVFSKENFTVSEINELRDYVRHYVAALLFVLEE